MDFVVKKGTKFQICEVNNGQDNRHDVFTFNKSGGIIMGMYNTDEVLFLKSCVTSKNMGLILDVKKKRIIAFQNFFLFHTVEAALVQ